MLGLTGFSGAPRCVFNFAFGKNLLDSSCTNVFLTRQMPGIGALSEWDGVVHLELFGSAAGSKFIPDSSDIDFLVELTARTRGFSRPAIN